MKIILLSNHEALDLPRDFKLSVEIHNPFFSEMGSTTLPIDLPATAHNVKILDMVGWQRKTRRVNSQRVFIEASGYRKTGVINFLGMSSGTISVNILLDEGEVYNAIESVKMLDVFSGIKKPLIIAPGEGRFQPYLMTDAYCEAFEWEPSTHDYLMFTLRIGIESTDEDSQLFINRTNVNSSQTGWGYYNFYARQARTYVIDDQQVSAGVGFGMSPQLRVGYVLGEIFRHLGFSLKNNIFNTDNVLKYACVVNNSVDSMMASVDMMNQGRAYLYYEHLVPTCSVSEFIDAVRKLFGVEFIFARGEVSIQRLDKKLSATITRDWSDKLESEPTYSFASPSRLDITCSASTAESVYQPRFVANMATDASGMIYCSGGYVELDKEYNLATTYEDMVNIFRTVHDIDIPEIHAYDTLFDLANIGGQIGFVAQYGNYYYSKEAAQLAATGRIDTMTWTYEPIGWGTIAPRADGIESSAEKNIGKILQNVRGILTVDSYRLVKSHVEVEGSESKDTDIPDMEIMFAFANNPYAERHKVNGVKNGADATNCATHGFGVGFSLLPDGPMGAFTRYEAYDSALRSGIATANIRPHLDALELSRLDITSRVLVDGVPMVARAIKYEIDNDDNVTVADSEYLVIMKKE